MPKYKPVVHMQDPKFTDRAMCGANWAKLRGGRVATTGLEPPIVVDEAGSTNAATCKTCLEAWRKREAKRLQ